MTSSLKLIAISVGGVAASILIFVFLLNPRQVQLTDLNRVIKERKIELITLEQQITAYNNAQSDLSKASRKNEILSAFVIREDLVGAVKSLEAAATATGTDETLKINEDSPKSVKPQDKTPDVIEGKQGLGEIPYRVTSYNDFIGTVQFLQYLEHLPQFTEIYKINLSSETLESELTGERIYTGRILGVIDGVFFIKPGSESPID